MNDEERAKAWEIFLEIGKLVFSYGNTESEDVVSYIEGELKAHGESEYRRGLRVGVEKAHSAVWEEQAIRGGSRQYIGRALEVIEALRGS